MRKTGRAPRWAIALALAVAAAGTGRTAGEPLPDRYLQVDLVGDAPGRAANHDPLLVDPRDIFAGKRIRVTDAGRGVSTSYFLDGRPAGWSVEVPSSRGPGVSSPTGLLYNDTGSFLIGPPEHRLPAKVLFATAGGTIAAWRALVDAGRAITVVDRSGAGASYAGLAMAWTPRGDRLYAADSAGRKVDVFDAAFRPVGSFADDALPADFAPSAVAEIGGRIWVVFAGRGEAGGPGGGNGAVDVFRWDGKLAFRFAEGPPLDRPTAVAAAPRGFGKYEDAILVGNAGDGRIVAFDRATGRFLGRLHDQEGRPVAIDGLRGLTFGTAGEDEPAGAPPKLYFAAAPDGGAGGLVGYIRPRAPAPATPVMPPPAGS